MSEPNPIRSYLASMLRHATTALLGLGGLLLSHDLIDPSDVAAVDAAGVSLQGALVVIVVAIIARLAITLTGKIFPAAAAKMTGTEAGGALCLWVGLGMAAGLLGCALPSCTPAQIAAARAIPVKACVLTDQGRVCYSSKGGLEAEIDATVRRRPMSWQPAAPLPHFLRPAFNPLDQPGSRELTAEELHRENLRAITGNPAY